MLAWVTDAGILIFRTNRHLSRYNLSIATSLRA